MAIQPNTGIQIGRPVKSAMRKKSAAAVQWMDARGEVVADDLVAHDHVLFASRAGRDGQPRGRRRRRSRVARAVLRRDSSGRRHM